MRRGLRIAAFIVATALVATACGDSSDDGGGSAATTSGAKAATTTLAPVKGGTLTIEWMPDGHVTMTGGISLAYRGEL